MFLLFAGAISLIAAGPPHAQAANPIRLHKDGNKFNLVNEKDSEEM